MCYLSARTLDNSVHRLRLRHIRNGNYLTSNWRCVDCMHRMWIFTHRFCSALDLDYSNTRSVDSRSTSYNHERLFLFRNCCTSNSRSHRIIRESFQHPFDIADTPLSQLQPSNGFLRCFEGREDRGAGAEANRSQGTFTGSMMSRWWWLYGVVAIILL